MAGVPGTIRRKGFRSWGLLCVGLLLVSLVAVLPATAPAAVVTEYVVPTPNSQPAGITVGPDGALWFTEENGHKIGRITTDGAITEYQIPTIPSAPGEITAGPDGNLWFTEFGANPPKVGRLTPSNPPVWREWELPPGSAPDGITTGPDGAIWFTENGTNKIGRISLDGTSVTECGQECGLNGFKPGDITHGPRWAAVVHRIRGSQGRRHQAWEPTRDRGIRLSRKRSLGHRRLRGLDLVHDARPGPGRQDFHARQSLEVFGPTGRAPSGIALGPDGALWFAETEANKIGRMTTTGRITEFALPFDPVGPNLPGEIVAGPDGAMWFTESGVNKIGRIEAGSSTSVFVPPPRPPPLPLTHADQEAGGGEERLPGAAGARSADRSGPEEDAAREVQVPHPRQGPRGLDAPAGRGAHPRDGAAEGEAALA